MYNNPTLTITCPMHKRVIRLTGAWSTCTKTDGRGRVVSNGLIELANDLEPVIYDIEIQQNFFIF